MKPINIIIILLAISSCSAPKQVDLIVYNANIYAVDDDFSQFTAMAIRDGKIVDTGNDQEIRSQYQADLELNMNSASIYPGFIDAHSHFISYGKSLVSKADLVGTKSYEEVIARLKVFEKEFEAEWLIGRGWDQNDWEDQSYPEKEALDLIWPDKAVYLTRIDGHAALLNSKAMELAGIDASTHIDGGEVLKKNGEPIGVLLDNAMEMVWEVMPQISENLLKQAISESESHCFAKGLTTVCDAGLEYDEVQLLDKMQKEESLKMRIYAMLTPTDENLEKMLPQGPYKTDRLNVRSIKLYADGALGSRGACLIHDYSDQSKWKGFMLSTQQYYDTLCAMAYSNGFQVNTHAIGDSANRVMLETYARYLDKDNDKRWRIEHAQVVHPDDFDLFGKSNIIPSVQPTHATSDMYWADERLGEERIKSAYAYEKLRLQNGWIPLGTDFPIEKIDPLLTFYAAVARKDLDNYPSDGFQMENALSREHALRGITIWAAKAAFEEQEKGSLEPGKLADFVVLDKDIMEIDETEIPKVSIKQTYLNGELVWER